MNPYPFMALFWLLLGGALLCWHTLHPEEEKLRFGGVSLGWLGLVMGLYNVAQWWRIRSHEARRRAEREEQTRRAARSTKEPEPDSPFKFTDAPPNHPTA